MGERASFTPIEVELRDRRRVRLREIRPDDEDEVRQAFGRLSSESRYTRFMSYVKELPPAMLERAVHPRTDRELGLVAEIDAPDGIGIVVTALVQSVIGGLGLLVTGVPYPALLTAVMFPLGVAQIGPVPVLLGAVIWLYWRDETLWGTVLVVWSLVTATLDNFVRPFLTRKGAHPAAAPDLRRCAGRPAGLRHHRAVHRPGGARGHLYLAAGMGGRGERPARSPDTGRHAVSAPERVSHGVPPGLQSGRLSGSSETASSR